MKELELTTAHSIAFVEKSTSSKKLELAHHKAKMIVVNNRKEQELIRAGDFTIPPKRYIIHFGRGIRRAARLV